MEKIPKQHKALIMGDVNARIDNIVINGIKQRFKNNEPHVNDSEQNLVEFCAQNELRINNTYKPISIIYTKKLNIESIQDQQ